MYLSVLHGPFGCVIYGRIRTTVRDHTAGIDWLGKCIQEIQVIYSAKMLSVDTIAKKRWRRIIQKVLLVIQPHYPSKEEQVCLHRYLGPHNGTIYVIW